MEMTFSQEACRAIDLILNSDKHVFITGKAGTGKSTLLEHVRHMSSSKTVVLAPTGVAAIHVGGETIHSFFGLKPGFEKDEARETKVNEHKAKKYRRLETILLDEISMVRADILDAINIFLRKTRKNPKPFGGVQMVFFGDLYQLPPVVTPADREQFYAEYDSPYFFDAEVFKGQDSFFEAPFSLEYIELTEMYRQKDDDFISLLNAVRDGTITTEELNVLNTRLNSGFVPTDEQYIYLMTTNADAQRINEAKLKALPSDERTFRAEVSGKIARNLYPNDDVVSVKVGAQVIFVYNDPERRWVNGTIGKVTQIKDHFLVVEKADGRTVEVAPYTWEISKYVFKGGQFVREAIGSFTQIPLKLAWAITIHKSQGKTFDRVIIDLGRGSFAHGQTYVALSRCTSLEGIVLTKKLDRRSIIMDPRVRRFGAAQRVLA